MSETAKDLKTATKIVSDLPRNIYVLGESPGAWRGRLIDAIAQALATVRKEAHP